MSSVAVVFSDDARQRFAEFANLMRTALSDDQVTQSFESLSEFIQKPAVLKASLLLLKAARNENLLAKPSPRTLLAAFLVAFHPADVLEITEEELSSSGEARALDRDCLSLAKEVISRVVDGDSIADLLEALNTFQNKFSEWKEFDRLRILRSLATAHYQWVASLDYLEKSRESSRDLESLQLMIDSANREMAANKRRILQMGGPEALEEILSTPPITVDLNEIITEVSSRKYWHDFAGEIRSGQYDRVIALLNEIRDRLKRLLPNRPDIQAEIDRSLDLDFIRQMIHFGSIDGAAFLQIFDVIWRYIKNWGASAAEGEWIEWRENVLSRTQTGTVTYDILLPEIFNRFLRQLDMIEDQTKRYREMLARNQVIPAPSSA